jgi:outer membrane immunogenic protein
MKKILLSTVALVSLSAGALAADLPARRMAPAPFVAAVPVFTWTGFYVGGNIGGAWRNADDDDNVFIPFDTIVNAPLTEGTLTFLDDDDNDGGITGGAQVGWNWQFGSFVWGVEADIQAVDLGGGRGTGSYFFDGVSLDTGLVAGTTTVFRSARSGLDWFGTVRARAGFAIDRVLIYATGGFAYGGGDDDNCGGFVFNDFVCDGGDDTRTGWTVGGGFEWALPMTAGWFGSSAVTFGVEALYVNLENDNGNNRSIYDPVNDRLFLGTDHDDDDFGVIRAKINFKF